MVYFSGQMLYLNPCLFLSVTHRRSLRRRQGSRPGQHLRDEPHTRAFRTSWVQSGATFSARSLGTRRCRPPARSPVASHQPRLAQPGRKRNMVRFSVIIKLVHLWLWHMNIGLTFCLWVLTLRESLGFGFDRPPLHMQENWNLTVIPICFFAFYIIQERTVISQKVLFTYLKNGRVIISDDAVVHQVLNRVLSIDHLCAVLTLNDKERLVDGSWVYFISVTILRLGWLSQWVQYCIAPGIKFTWHTVLQNTRCFLAFRTHALFVPQVLYESNLSLLVSVDQTCGLIATDFRDLTGIFLQ